MSVDFTELFRAFNNSSKWHKLSLMTLIWRPEPSTNIDLGASKIQVICICCLQSDVVQKNIQKACTVCWLCRLGAFKKHCRCNMPISHLQKDGACTSMRDITGSTLTYFFISLTYKKLLYWVRWGGDKGKHQVQKHLSFQPCLTTRSPIDMFHIFL